MRIAVASEVLKRWIGGEVAIAGPDPGQLAEGYWFSEGVARALARSMLARFGQITPGEAIAEIDRLETIARTSRLAAQGNAAVAARIGERGAAALLVARGALYATRVDGLLRAKSGGKRTLEDVARALLARAKEARGPLPERAWLDALQDDLGAGESAAYAAAITRGEVPSLPQEALGKCASRGARRYVGYDLGFDLEATRDAGDKIVGLGADGPAAKAGLAAGDRLLEAHLAGDDAEKPITVVVERAGARRELKYAPTGPSARGEAWSRRRDVPDEACAK
jgi:predicted metalloprotease with PDZ domain